MVEDREPELIDAIVGQYVRLAGTIDLMFQVISPRVKYTAALWRQDGPFKGSGSCRDMDKYNSEIGLVGIAKDVLILLREERNRQIPGISLVSDCPYHRCEGGCVLKELKSPHCLAHMEAAWELRKFGQDGYLLSKNIGQWLRQALAAESLEEVYARDGLINTRAFHIKCLTERIEQFPHIGLPDRP